MPDIDLTIPDFLLHENSSSAQLTPEQEARVKQLLAEARSIIPRRRGRQRFDLPQQIEPKGRELLKQIEKDKAERQAARFKELRERRHRHA
jgi:hypothetical protein